MTRQLIINSNISKEILGLDFSKKIYEIISIIKKAISLNSENKSLFQIWSKIGHRISDSDFLTSKQQARKKNPEYADLLNVYCLECFFALFIRCLSAIKYFNSEIEEMSSIGQLEQLFLKIKQSTYSYLYEDDVYNIFTHSFFLEITKDFNKKLSTFFLDLLSKTVTIIPKRLFFSIYHTLLDKKLRKLLGEFYTPIEVSKIMVKWVLNEKFKESSVIDTNCGAGNLIIEYLENSHDKYDNNIREVVGIDLNPLAVLLTKFILTDFTNKKNFLINRFHVLNADTITSFIASKKILSKKKNLNSKTMKKNLSNFLNIPNYPLSIEIEFQSELFEIIIIKKDLLTFSKEMIKKEIRIQLNGKSLFFELDNELMIYINNSKNKNILINLLTDNLKTIFLLTKKYNVILGNPPYVRVQSIHPLIKRELIKSNYQTAVGHFDLYYCFFEINIEILHKNGVLVYLTSNKFMNTSSGSILRKILFENSVIDFLINFNDSHIFDALILPVIIILRKRIHNLNGKRNVKYISAERSKNIENNNVVDEYLFSFFQSFGSPIINLGVNYNGNHLILNKYVSYLPKEYTQPWSFPNPKIIELLKTIESNSNSKLGELAKKVVVGIKTTANYAFIDDYDPQFINRKDIIKQRNLIKKKYKRDLFFPIIRGKDIRNYSISENNNSIFYPHYKKEGKNHSYPEEDLQIILKYLKQKDFFNKLNRREYIIKSKKNWYEIWNQKDSDDFECGIKIVVPDISPKNNFAIDFKNKYVVGSAYYIKLKNEDLIDAKVILAQLNSYILEFYHKNKSNNKIYAGRFRYWSSDIENFPIINPMDIKHEIKLKIEKLIDQIEQNYNKRLEDDINDIIFYIFNLKDEIKQFISDWVYNDRK